ncbi:MAG: hypothetical protein WA814_00840, partial [Candidatus Baltobacteraceae bacterium]
PIADNGRNLYVASFDDSEVFTYKLPLVSGPPSQGFFADVADPTAIALEGRYLFVAGLGDTGFEVLEYKLPLVADEKPSGAVSGFSYFDFLSLTARNKLLYVASAADGSVGAYPLPLQLNEKPTYTIPTVKQSDGATGLAVDRNGSQLYVSLYGIGKVYAYRLPYALGDVPKVLDVRSETGGLPFGLAIGDKRLFVTTGQCVLAYRLPFMSSMTPEINLTFNGNAVGVAVDQ